MNNAHGIVAGGCTTPPGQPGAFGPKRKLTKQDAERLVARVRQRRGLAGANAAPRVAEAQAECTVTADSHRSSMRVDCSGTGVGGSRVDA